MGEMILYNTFFGNGRELPIFVDESHHVTIRKHGHEFFELVFVREGYCLHHLGDSVYLAMEGDILLIKPGTYHQYTGNRECKIYNCLFTKQSVEETIWQKLMELPGGSALLGEEPEKFPPLHMDMSERKEVVRLLEQMKRECKQKETGFELSLQVILTCLLVKCARLYVTQEDRRAETDCYLGYVTRALGYIDEHYTRETLSVHEIAEYTEISGDYLSKQFRRKVGIGTLEYVRRYRLSRAIISLQQGSAVTDAALLNGFHSVEYFARVFKKEMGMTPSQYKDMYLGS